MISILEFMQSYGIPEPVAQAAVVVIIYVVGLFSPKAAGWIKRDKDGEA